MNLGPHADFIVAAYAAATVIVAALIAWVLIVTILGAVIGVPILVVVTLWLVYRIARGWLRLRDKRPMYV